jgi:hypothetical protein
LFDFLSLSNIGKKKKKETNHVCSHKEITEAEGVAQVVKYLPRKCKALSSNSSTTTTTSKKEKEISVLRFAVLIQTNFLFRYIFSGVIT